MGSCFDLRRRWENVAILGARLREARRADALLIAAALPFTDEAGEMKNGCNRRKGVKMDLVLIILGAIVLFLVTVTHDSR